ncbi:MAG: hypothetical protein ACI4QA_04405 [Candidatus Spyradosoma sp.]
MAKAVRIRIVSGGESHSDLESLLRNFAPADLVPAIADGRLARWLQTKNAPSDLFEGLTKLEKQCPPENASAEEKAKFCANLCLKFFSCSCRDDLRDFFERGKKLSGFVEFLLGKSEYKKSALGIWEYTLCRFSDIEKLAESAKDAPTRIWNRLELENAEKSYILHCKGICREKGIGCKENFQEAIDYFQKSGFDGDRKRAEKICLKEDRTKPFLEQLKEFEIRTDYTNFCELRENFENLVGLCDSWIFKRECDEELKKGLKNIAEDYLRRWVDKSMINVNLRILRKFRVLSSEVRSFLAGIIMDVEFEKNKKITRDMIRYTETKEAPEFEDARWLAYCCLVYCNYYNDHYKARQAAKKARKLDEDLVGKIAELMKKNSYEKTADMLSDPNGFFKKEKKHVDSFFK